MRLNFFKDAPASKSAVLLIYTGGTIGMKEDPVDGALRPFDYDSLLERSIMVTLAEAAASWIDTELRHRLPEGPSFRIVRPAAGYASCPDHSLKKDILALLPGADRLGISLTESYAMIPDSSICGLIFVHPEACYPEIRGISRKTAEDYARRRGMSDSEMQKLLGNLL